MTLVSAAVKVLALGLLLSPPRGAYHELQDNRATLVLRDRTHLSVTMYINYAEALHRALAPQVSLQEFVLAYSAMSPGDFEAALRRAHDRFRSGTRVARADAEEVKLGHWKWPDARRVQALLQRQAMQAVVAPNDHAHEQPLEIRADGVAAQTVSAVTLQLPVEFQRVLVVSYRPNQVWLAPAAAARITF